MKIKHNIDVNDVDSYIERVVKSILSKYDLKRLKDNDIKTTPTENRSSSRGRVLRDNSRERYEKKKKNRHKYKLGIDYGQDYKTKKFKSIFKDPKFKNILESLSKDKNLDSHDRIRIKPSRIPKSYSGRIEDFVKPSEYHHIKQNAIKLYNKVVKEKERSKSRKRSKKSEERSKDSTDDNYSSDTESSFRSDTTIRGSNITSSSSQHSYRKRYKKDNKRHAYDTNKSHATTRKTDTIENYHQVITKLRNNVDDLMKNSTLLPHEPDKNQYKEKVKRGVKLKSE